MVRFQEVNGALALDELDAVEDAASDIGRALEGVEPAGRHEDEMVALREPGCDAVVEPVAQEIAPDARGRGQGEVKVEERGAGIGWIHALGKEAAAAPRERRLDLAHGDEPARDRPLGEEGRPIGGAVAHQVHPRPTAQNAAAARDGARGLQDRVAEDDGGDGGAADGFEGVLPGPALDPHGLAYVEAGELVDELLKTRVRNAEHEDGLVMLDDAGTRDEAIKVDAHQYIEWLSGESDRGDHRLGREDVAHERLVPIGGRGGRVAVDGAKAGRVGEHVLGRRQVLRTHRPGRRHSKDEGDREPRGGCRLA